MIRHHDQPGPADFELRFRARPESLCVIRAAVRKATELAGFSEKDVNALSLAVEEALTNVIRHSYGGPCSEPIILQISRLPAAAEAPEKLEFRIRDFGRQVDPAAIRSRDLDDIRPGGLGVHIIRSIMDEVEYSCPAGGGMLLRLAKAVPAQAVPVKKALPSPSRCLRVEKPKE